MKEIIATLLAGTALVLGLGHILIAAGETTEAPDIYIMVESGEYTATTDVIEEDDPRWDCRTMGNLVCGDD